ncbi:pyrroline-5-carboxylate reductase [Helicobacter cholecystus]|uniref:Pyrroline-5-carboxylate reductase n=1 Tax=Helicobacter cholecystus TaxID=45498 RepID=A0A3D8IUX0_9HELI|nr:pyrroline-5-carboxylate reductase [Helicobacter cholecystus]RDU69058.1 pyrroline-5-carboxylate reductase [Helicobacter cholecystus]VEJ24589.1 pyrroline-5-carboxylate reductase [Helicobacter cholecystus]
MQSLLIIGYGNLAHAIVKGISPNIYKLFVLGRDFYKSQAFCKDFPNHSITPISNIQELKNQFPIILICIKPKGLQSFSCDFATPLVYSVMAGVKVQSLISQFPQAHSYIRSMPNVGAFVKKSATTLYAYSPNPSALAEAKQQAQTLSLAFGNAVWVESEDLIDASIATSGSSPAFLALVAQALIDAGVREGLTITQSTELVRATFQGFAKLLNHSSPLEIKTLVTSPAGTTAEGLVYLEEKGFKGILEQGAHQSVLKARGKI